jgi:hypothetical protein
MFPAACPSPQATRRDVVVLLATKSDFLAGLPGGEHTYVSPVHENKSTFSSDIP